MKVLVLDGETNQALACVRSLGRQGHDVVLASCWRKPLAGWSCYCRSTYRICRMSREGYAELRAWAIRQEVECVLPLTERSCVLCNLERGEWERAGMIVGCGDAELLQKAFDKRATLEHAARCDVAIPPTCFPNSLADCRSIGEKLGFPCVVKARYSNAWVDGHFLPDRSSAYVADQESLERAVLERVQGESWPMVQGFVAGTGKGVFALCNRGNAVAWFCHERLRDVRPTGSGSSLRRSVRADARLVEPASRLLEELNWSGPAMVEFRDDQTQPPWLMEVNGRFWNSLQLAISAGVDFPRIWLELLAGRAVEPCHSYEEGVVVRWLWGDVKRFMHILAGKPPGFRQAFPTRWQGLRELLGPQPPRTQCETWDRQDPWPALGEWVQGVTEVLAR